MTQGQGGLVEGQHYYCGTCVGHGVVWCDYCVEGNTAEGPCQECTGGQVVCPQCKGGTKPVPPPWDS
jgi:hypothetical protein